MLFNKTKYVAIFLDKIQDTYKIVKKKRFKPLSTEITYKDKTYLIDKSITGFSKRMKVNFFFDLITGQLSFHKVETIDPKLLSLVLSSGIISNITSGLTKKSSFDFTNIFPFIIGGIIGFLIGFMFV